MEFYNRRQLLSPILLVIVYVTIFVDTHSHHIRHHRDRFKRQHGANLYLPGSYVTDSDNPDAGPWQDWSEPSPCSRTCGGGVSTQYRSCTQGYDCQGATKRHFSCNTQDCPDSGDYRSQQCSEFDNIPFEGVTYSWVPYTKAPNPCELNCMPRGERFYYRHRLHVADGTRCNDENLDVCVAGKCQPVGCDAMLGSNAREDNCRVCGGDGSTCKTVTGTLDMQDLQVGYNDILLIPAGATNIHVREREPSNNYLAVRNTSGHYHLNGNWRIDFPRTLDFAGCKFHYDRYPQGFSAPDSVSCIGPTDEPLFIVLLYQDTNVGVEYEYSLPQNIVPSSESETYAWTFDQFTPCTSGCGGGVQYRNVSCAGRRTLEPADITLCDPSNRPEASQRCNENPCDARWVTKPWNKCSAPCGVGGSQNRQILCEQVISNGVASIVDDEQCQNIQKPESEQPCNQGMVCASWHEGPWKPCDHLCGEGKETRVVTCYRKNKEGKIEKLEDSDCSQEPKPETEKKCNVRPCEGVDWVSSEWSGCDKCGLSTETRRVQCATAKGQVFPDSLCDGEEKPDTERECTTSSTGCDYEWYASQWSECSAACGKGVQTRKVFCASIEDLQKADDGKCDAAKKYNASMECEAEQEVCLGEWFSGPWSKCSKECGGGEKTRKVICMRDDQTVAVTDCGPDTIPSGSEACGEQACDKDEVLPVDATKPVDVTDVTDVTESGTLMTDATDLTTESSDQQTTTDDEYEIVDDDECEDGEWVDADDEDEDDETKTSEMDKSEATEESSPFGSSTETSFTDGSSESTLFDDDVMLSDTTATGDETDSTASLETGSGDMSTDVDTESSKASGDTETTMEGSGDDEQTTVSGIIEDSTSDSSAKESSSTDASDSSSDVTESSDSSSDVTSLSSDVSDLSSDVTGLSSVTDSSTDLTDLSSDVTGSSDVTSSDDTTESSDVTTSSDDASESTIDVSASSDVSDSTSDSTETSIDGSSETSSDSSDSTSDETTEPTESTETTFATDDTESTDTSMSSESTETTEFTSESTTDLESTTDGSTDLTTENMETTTEDDEDDYFIGEKDDATKPPKKAKLIKEEAATTESGSSETTDDSTETTEFSTTEITTEDTASTEISTTEITTEYTGSPESTTEYTGTTESTTEYTGSSEETTEYSGSTDVSGSSEATTEYIGSSESTTEYTGSTESTTEYTGSTESTTEFIGSTESTTEFTGSTEIDIWSTTETGSTEWGTTDISELFTPKPKRCRRRKQKSCKKSKFGCCFDKLTPADGPFDKGCPTPETCKETTFGCCEDGVSPALGKKFKGCPSTHCDETLFGCCPDKKTPAEGENEEGCPPPPPKCLKAKFGCCNDNITEAKGPKQKGCEAEPETEEGDCTNSTFGCCPDGTKSAKGEYFKGCDIIKPNCTDSHFGCCPDGKMSAEGPNYRGCKTACGESPFGCCEDGITPAHGYSREGCCLATPHGCCPDNIKPADGPNLEGCGCQYSSYRCCPDNITSARGYNNEGCGCQHTEHGCCPDAYNPAAGPEYQGCQCHTFQFGCCPDGESVAKGPHQQGCGCRNTEFGCCSDNQTPATGANMEGCGCASTKFGCCYDGATESQGDNFEGCTDVPENLQAGCMEEKVRGSCRNYTVKWYFDMEYGGCSRFWYGGCDGNNNRYRSQEECKAICIEPQGKDRCKLPKISGPCEGYYPNWYYDKDRNHCAQFIYGGCLGNNNRFETKEECATECVTDVDIDACDQPQEAGPCRGQYLRWYYNKEATRCEQFYYGGCKSNSNNFPTEMACKQQCAASNRKKDHCSLPRAQGNCTAREPRWFYDASEKRCMPFYYSGCEGNKNSFISQQDCESDCPNDVEKDTCHLAAEVGECADYAERWYYDTKDKACRQFYYGGCGGNGNNFVSEVACTQRCEMVPTPAPRPEPEQPTGQRPDPEEPFRTDFCFQPSETGPCRESEARWFYDRDGVCKQFMFGGCDGNRNNFKSMDECHQNCGNAQDLCTLPVVVGPCHGEFDQFYYDYQSDNCAPFKYGGCLGNDNRFGDQATCEQRCKRGPITATQGPPPAHVPQETDDTAICFHPADPGNCTDSVPSFFYDAAAQRCSAFIYTGCGGNANRYNSEEQCERQCGRFRGQDVCNMPRDPGPCRGYFIKSYYDRNAGHCGEFAYGGCDGNGNRFSSVQECENICITHEESKPNITSSDICHLPLDIGACGEQSSHKRWYFDDQRGECIAFIYSGCGGNFNRFKSFQACVDSCRDYMVYPQPQNEIDSNDHESQDCDRYKDECRTMHCPYGLRAFVDNSMCTRCDCLNPCDGFNCPEQTLCAVDLNINRTSEEDESFVPVCREVNKAGDCPHLQASADQCYEECRNDADCTIHLKCCNTGCGTSCVAPHVDVPAELITSGYQPAYTESPVLAGYYPPAIDEEVFEPEVSAREGEYATLRCAVRGNPNPNITWSKENLVIDGRQARYRLLLDGALQIITLHKTDSGIYLCTADNNIGAPLKKEIRLDVTDGVNSQAEVFDAQEEKNVVVSLGSPASLQCYALGFPFPSVTWWKDDAMIPLKTSQFEVRKDYSLLIHQVQLSNLGLYTCQAYNGFGKAASWVVVVQAHGPVYSSNPDDAQYMKYVVDAPTRPTVTERPQWPYRPARPSPTPRPAYYRPTPQPYEPPPYVEPNPEIENEVRPEPQVPEAQPGYGQVYTVPVTTNISLPNPVFGIGSDVNIPCDVDGYPTPQVQWFKDNEPLYPSEHLEITESHRIIIKKANQSESGNYRCEAYNQYYRADSMIRISVEGMYIDPSCTDNPFFANCLLIVRANFCTHKYYAKFCCKSCTQDGQLPSRGPHIDHPDHATNNNLI